jgi:CheY-like chemotaxis protein
MAELLQGSALDPGQRAQVEAIQRAGGHLLRLVNDALDLARIEAGRLPLEVSAFELRPLLDEVAGLLQPLAAAKPLSFVLQADPALPVAFEGDATRLRQILFNLGHNAIKFCAHGEVRLRVSPRSPEGLVLEVEDTGPGLDAEQQVRLFQRFEAGSRSGSGLGLAISQELAMAMGGSIRVRSEPGQGACFRVELPLPAAPPPFPLAPPRGHAAPRRVLLVEDEPLVAEVVTALLQRQGHQVVRAPQGLAALAELETGVFDLALLDLDLPGIDGIALARLVRARGHTLPMLALTARSDPAAEPAARAAGMDGFLRKPVTGDVLAGALAAAIAD